jgi:hypothetical protein
MDPVPVPAEVVTGIVATSRFSIRVPPILSFTVISTFPQQVLYRLI